MKRLTIYILALLSLTSCLLENDLSYPKMPMDITGFEVEGQKSVTINPETRTVDLVMEETADLANIRVKNITVSEGAQIVGSVPAVLNLTTPASIVLKTYGTATWTIKATQPIERYIRVENQIGEAQFNLETHTAYVTVTESQSFKDITFLEMKLEREPSVIVSTTGYHMVGEDGILETVLCHFPMVLECVLVRTFLVKLPDNTEVVWTVRLLQHSVSQEITSVDAWYYHAIVKGTFSGNGTPKLEYRKAGDEQWTAVADAAVSGVEISADIKGLAASTDYEVRLSEGDAVSEVYAFKTGTPQQLDNMSFDNWHQAGKVWYPYPEGADLKVWDSANAATAGFIGSSTVPEESFVVKGKAAKMESKYAVIAFAAGNLYTGKFGKIAGLGAELDWGIPFSERPSALKGYYSYVPKPIDKADDKYASMLGTMDKCQILVILADWDEPFHINTTKGEFVDTANDPGIIAFAKMETDKATDGYVEFNLPLEYRNSRTPKYVVIAACASYMGDYFTGGVGSLMYVDEFEFVYE